MQISQFDQRYKRKGGIQKLSDMRAGLNTQDEIAIHFGVCKERVRQWMRELFSEEYDPRAERKKRKVEGIVELIKRFGIIKTKELYPGINKQYLKEAIKISKK